MLMANADYSICLTIILTCFFVGFCVHSVGYDSVGRVVDSVWSSSSSLLLLFCSLVPQLF